MWALDVAAQRHIGPAAVGPKAAIAALGKSLGTLDEAKVWKRRARLEAVVGPFANSVKDMKAAARRWYEFCESIKAAPGTQLPITEGRLLHFSMMFRTSAYFGNVCSHLRTISELFQWDVSAFSGRLVSRARAAIDKRCKLERKELHFI